MKVIAYIPLHYGAEYLRQAAESVEPFVDQLLVYYTPQPSYGHPASDVENPDGGRRGEEKLRACCDAIPAHKLHWHQVMAPHTEGDHRGAAVATALNLGATIILPVDADEIWEQTALESLLRQAVNFQGGASRFLVRNFVHFWRSFDWCCRDVWAPVRILKPAASGSGGDFTFSDDEIVGDAIYHFGYAQSEAITRYKWTIHGHQNELRPGWFDEIFLDETRKTDLHPVVKDWWNAVEFDKATLPAALHKHPYYDLRVIR